MTFFFFFFPLFFSSWFLRSRCFPIPYVPILLMPMSMCGSFCSCSSFLIVPSLLFFGPYVPGSLVPVSSMLSNPQVPYVAWLLGSYVCVLILHPDPCCLVSILFSPQVLLTRSICHQIAGFYISWLLQVCLLPSPFYFPGPQVVMWTHHGFLIPRSLGIYVAWSLNAYIAICPDATWSLQFLVPVLMWVSMLLKVPRMGPKQRMNT